MNIIWGQQENKKCFAARSIISAEHPSLNTRSPHFSRRPAAQYTAGMDTIAAINARYSCRAYLDKPVPRPLLEQIIDAGRRAPSARKVEPVFFVAVTEPARRARLAELLEYGRFVAQAGACIAVYSHPTKYYLEDGCIAAENILIAATALGLQSCWIAGDKKEYAGQVSQLLGVAAEDKLITLLAIGYAKEPGRQPEHRPLQQVLHWQQYSA